jgi:hypothetical protein
MTFREKSAWVMMTLMLGAGLYYANLAKATWQEAGPTIPPLAVLIAFTIFITVSSVIAQTVLAIMAPKDANAPADERERPILNRAGHWSGMVLAIGAMTSLLYFLYHQSGVLLFHMVMGSLIMAQIAEYASQIVLIRRSS